MILKSTLLAVVISFGSLTVAEAQSQSYVNTGLIVGWGNATPGWSYNNISQCVTAYDGANTWNYAFFGNGGSQGYIVTNNPSFAPLIASACQSGNLFGLYVIEFAPSLVWTQVATFPSK